MFVLKGLRARGSAQAAERGFWGQVNLRQQFLKMIDRAGIKPWPKLFHNLRASAQTDLAARFPIHVVCDWLGSTKAVAQEHYLQTTDADFDKATAVDATSEKAAQKAAQHVRELTSYNAHGEPENAKTPGNPGVLTNKVAVVGLEEPVFSSGKTTLHPQGDAKSDALAAATELRAEADESLLKMIEAWPSLSPEHRQILSVQIEAFTRTKTFSPKIDS